nr:MAG TPA: hypothetical protein [Caudoviricetes sp.]
MLYKPHTYWVFMFSTKSEASQLLADASDVSPRSFSFFFLITSSLNVV